MYVTVRVESSHFVTYTKEINIDLLDLATAHYSTTAQCNRAGFRYYCSTTEIESATNEIDPRRPRRKSGVVECCCRRVERVLIWLYIT